MALYLIHSSARDVWCGIDRRNGIFKKKLKFKPKIIESVDDFIKAINEEDNVNLKINENLSLTSSINISKGKKVIIDLNGKTINSNNSTAFNVKGGELIISNGNITGSQRAVIVNDGSAIINDGTYTTTSEGQVVYASGANSFLTINGGTFNSQECGAMAFDGATLTINGGTFNTIDNFAIGTNGSTGRGNNTIIINKAVINANIISNGYEACGIYIPNNDRVTIGPDVEINVINGCGILMRAGEVIVKKGVKINISTNKEDGFSGWVGDNKTKMKQSGIIYHESANYPAKTGMKLTVENGVSINAVDENIEILSNEENPQVIIL